MAAFRDENEYAEELALRTLLNYYRFKMLDNSISHEELLSAQAKYSDVRAAMRHRGFRDLEICIGTQMLNSLIGLLILPQQQYFENIKSITRWRDDLPILAHYVFDSEYFYDVAKEQHRDDYRPTLGRILRKMRNAISHDRIQLLPVSSNGDEVTDIVFEDALDKTSDIEFRLVIKKDDLEKLLVEISEYFINTQWIKSNEKFS